MNATRIKLSSVVPGSGFDPGSPRELVITDTNLLGYIAIFVPKKN